jgi:hypothetical protein
VLEAQTTSSLLDAGFGQILASFSVKSGKIIIYNPDADSYDIYVQSGLKRKMIRNAQIDRDSPLIRRFHENNAIIYRKRLSLELEQDRKLNDELIRLGGEIAVAIFYYNRFLGVLILGDRMMRYSADEIALLSSFASKIGILFLNSFLWKESLAKGDIKREYEMGLKVQRSFNSEHFGKVGRLEYAMVLKDGMEPFFFHSVYQADGKSCVSVYRQNGAQPGALVFSPLLIPLTQTFARFGYSPSETVGRTNRVVSAKKLLEGTFPVMQMVFDSGLRWKRDGFSSPLLFDPLSPDTRFVQDRDGTGETEFKPGSIVLFFDASFMRTIGTHYEEILFILKTNHAEPIKEIVSLLTEKLSASYTSPDFFCVLRVAK